VMTTKRIGVLFKKKLEHGRGKRSKCLEFAGAIKELVSEATIHM